MKILCVGYRNWSKSIYYTLQNDLNKRKFKFFFHFEKKSLYKKILKTKPNLILFYGWSWIIKKKIYQKYKCLMLHPSPLPKYRGGSPIQNQIIRNKKNSMVSIFQINNIIDGGGIYFQKRFSLEGTLDEIFSRIIKLGIEGTKKILNKKILPKRQNHKIATYYSRIKIKDSEITLQELKFKLPAYIYNKLRMLQDPYPNPFIRLRNGKKLHIKKFYISK